jgi:hypothetical protein
MRTFRRPALALFVAPFLTILRTAPAQAHAFGARYDLPLPLELYLAGAGAAVALSFVIPTRYGSICSASRRFAHCFTRRCRVPFR